MESLHERFDDVSSPRYDENATASRAAEFNGVQGRIVHKLRRAAAALSGHEIGFPAHAWLNCTADYIERIEPETIQRDFTKKVRHNPGTSLLVAGAAGFILSSILRRR